MNPITSLILRDLPSPISDCKKKNQDGKDNFQNLGYYYNACVILLLSLINAALRKSKEPVRVLKQIPSEDGVLNNLNFYNFRNIKGTAFTVSVFNIFNSSGSLVPNSASTFVYQAPPGKKVLFLGNSVINNAGLTAFDVFDSSNVFEYRASLQTSGFLSTVFLLKDEQILRVFNNTNGFGDVITKGFEFDASVPIDIQVSFFQTSDPVGSLKVVLDKPADTTKTIRRIIPPNFFTRQHQTILFLFVPFTVVPSTIAHDIFVDQNIIIFGGLFTNITSSAVFVLPFNSNYTLINNEISLLKFSSNVLNTGDFWTYFVYFDESV
jgi:hypothetical protein